MSSGQKPRTREHFPRMKERGRARRRRTPYVSFPDAITVAFSNLAASVSAVASVFGHVFAGVQRAVEEESRLAFEYILSERYQLDRIERERRGDPIAHSNAVAEFFTRRAHRELDSLAQSILWDGAPALFTHLGSNFAPPSIVAKRGDVIGRIGGPRRGAHITHTILNEARRLS